LDLQGQARRHAAKARSLPDQFVVMGFEAGKQTLFKVGKPVPLELQVGPDPAAAGDDQLKGDGPNLKVPDELKWMTDFDAAVEKGMGFRLSLSATQARGGFDRLFVLGLRMSASAA